MRKILAFVGLSFFLCFVACAKDPVEDSVIYDGVFVPEYITASEVQRRAEQLATLEWVPAQTLGSSFKAGRAVNGVPYSSVKEINTFLGQDVSLYTFMTAVHNPRSVFYTVNISKPPYHGVNASLYYGSVCSACVMYALGIPIPYYSKAIPKLPYVDSVDASKLENLRVGDIICRGTSHTLMIYNLQYRADTVYKVSVYEAPCVKVRLIHYSVKEFRSRWQKENLKAFRCRYVIDDIGRSTTAPKRTYKPDIVYNDDLCASKGDKSVYRTTDSVVINVFNFDYPQVGLYKGNELIGIMDNKDSSASFTGLQAGQYQVRLTDGSRCSEPTSFEVIDATTSIQQSVNLTVHFSSTNATPLYVVVCTRTGGFYTIHYLGYAERLAGKTAIAMPKGEGPYYCKVIFQGEYGNVSSIPLRLN